MIQGEHSIADSQQSQKIYSMVKFDDKIHEAAAEETDYDDTLERGIVIGIQQN